MKGQGSLMKQFPHHRASSRMEGSVISSKMSGLNFKWHPKGTNDIMNIQLVDDTDHFDPTGIEVRRRKML